MPIRTILVSFDGSEQSKATLEAALWVARGCAAHADVLHVRTDPLESGAHFGEASDPRLDDHLAQHAHGDNERAAWKARDLFHQACNRNKIAVIERPFEAEAPTATWIEREGRRHEAIAALGRVHDLVVVGQPSHPGDLAGSMTIDALFSTGRPVLVMPHDPPPALGRRIAIAWNGSAECARAVGGATDFLARADSIVVLTAESDRTPSSVAPELATYLEWHGRKPESRVFAHLGKRHLGGKMLLEACQEEGADLLVMGAMRTTRFRELLLGRATRQVLRMAPIPVLMGH